MSDLTSELKANYNTFRKTLRKDFVAADKALDPDGKVFFDAYRRLASLNSWRADLLEKTLDQDASNFILEAQSDGLSSLAFATVGAWRTSLQCLRSMIENTLLGLYFADHPIEYQLWAAGRFKIGFSALATYFADHPSHQALSSSVDPLPLIRAEYDTLSKAVHGQAPFRMTKDAATTVVCNTSAISRGAYLTRQRETVRGISLLCLMLFPQHLQGTKQQALRAHLSILLSAHAKATIKSHYKVILT